MTIAAAFFGAAIVLLAEGLWLHSEAHLLVTVIFITIAGVGVAVGFDDGDLL